MASALTVLLLGCWLAGHSGVWGEPSYPKPNISLSPSGGVSLGGSVTILCCGQHEGLQFVLNKEGRHVQTVNADDLALFHINNVSREHGGSYNCSYHNQSEPSAVSDPSDPVELVVIDPGLPRANISLNHTAPGADATIRCEVQGQNVSFFLHKAGDLNPQQHMDPAGDVAEFRVPTEHGGNYSCSYRPRSEPFVSSLPSDPVKITAAGGSAPPRLTFIVGVSAAASLLLLLLLLLVAFVCFRKIRARRGAASRPSSTSPMGPLNVPAREEHIYTSIDEGKETQSL